MFSLLICSEVRPTTKTPLCKAKKTKTTQVNQHRRTSSGRNPLFRARQQPSQHSLPVNCQLQQAPGGPSSVKSCQVKASKISGWRSVELGQNKHKKGNSLSHTPWPLARPLSRILSPAPAGSSAGGEHKVNGSGANPPPVFFHCAEFLNSSTQPS